MITKGCVIRTTKALIDKKVKIEYKNTTISEKDIDKQALFNWALETPSKSIHQKGFDLYRRPIGMDVSRSVDAPRNLFGKNLIERDLSGTKLLENSFDTIDQLKFGNIYIR